ncbi:MAG: hypothetical protein IKP22_08935 [Clostridia bacterium]|nr:hypothetical protein [Clostridia bacterium]
MIPFASLCVLLLFPSGSLETAAMDLGALGCTFRLPPADAGRIGEVTGCEFRFRSPAGESRCTLPRGAFTVRREETAPGWTLFRLETDDAVFRKSAMEYMRFMLDLPEMSLGGEEKSFPDSADSAVRDMLRGVRADKDWGEGMEIWLELAGPDEWEDFLALPAGECLRRRLDRRGLRDHPLAEREICGVQAGNPFCPALRPDRAVLDRLREKAARQGLRLSLALAPVNEGDLDRVLRDLEDADEEIAVNDWGTAVLMKSRKKAMGVLLNRQWKDPRLTGAQAELLRQNDACGEEYLRFLRGLGFERLEWEACGRRLDLPAMKGTLRLPFWQANTSSRCPVRAVWEHGDRGRQFPMGPCTAPCREKTLIYPVGSGVICRWNTLFGCDAKSLSDGEWLRQAHGRGADRVLLDL